jgi:hypothetical protein
MKTETTSFAALCDSMNVSITSTTPIATVDAEGWEHFAFACQLSRNGKPFWSGPFRKGLGHVKLTGKSFMLMLSVEEDRLFHTLKSKPNAKMLPGCEHIKAGLFTKLAKSQKLTCNVEDVFSCLLSDGSSCFDGVNFADWCDEFGYSNDSIKARQTYDACEETGKAIRKAFTLEEIESLRTAANEL